jgi:hypothetical protein
MPTREERILAKMEDIKIEAEARRRLAKEKSTVMALAFKQEQEYQRNWVPPVNPDMVKLWKFNGYLYFRDGHNDVWTIKNGKVHLWYGVYKPAGPEHWQMDEIVFSHDLSHFQLNAARVRREAIQKKREAIQKKFADELAAKLAALEALDETEDEWTYEDKQ